MKKAELPGVIARVLGIENPEDGWVSNGDTVNAAWHVVVGEALDVPHRVGKVEHMQNLLASVGVAWEPARHSSEHTASKGGANVRKEAYEDLLAALRASPHAKLAASIATEDSLYDDDHGNWVTRSIRLRRGQPKFRAALLEAYAGRCAVTGSETVSVLEAAHIRPFADGGAAVVQNGLLLRADVHTLFDLGRIGITEDYFVVMHPSLSSSEYSQFAGQLAHVPASRPQRPDGALLEQHVSKWALGS